MTARVIPIGIDHRSLRGGTICVMGNLAEGFQVAHESRSGDSWGSFHGPFYDGQEAIRFAYSLNRSEYGGDCNVSICDDARDHASRCGNDQVEF